MFVLAEQSDVFVDAMAADHHAQLLFVSVFGRDTSIQQFMARLHQSSRDGGVDEISASERHGQKPALRVLVGDPKRLEKSTGRLAKTGLLGNLVHAWIFDPSLLVLDHATRSAWVLDDKDDRPAQLAEAWRLVKELSPVPLLDVWRTPVMAHVQATSGLASPPTIGRIRTLRIELQDDFAAWVSRSIQDGLLPVDGCGSMSALVLQAA